ncbi:MAG: LamG-like jellyroll fold domain-containing protein, partial [Lentisphaerota bacterium]
PGFFIPEDYTNGVYRPIVGVPPYIGLNDGWDLFSPWYDSNPMPFNPFAPAVSGILFRDNDGDGRFTPGVDDCWQALAAAGVYTVGDPIIANNGAPLVGGEAGLSIIYNISTKWPMNGMDTDDDGLPDALEIQMDVAAGKNPSSPVQSHSPFRLSSAFITSSNGVSPYLFDQTEDDHYFKDGRRFFSRDFTVETWVYLKDTSSNDYRGAFIQGLVWLAEAAAETRVGFELGVEPISGFNSVPYVSFNTLANHRYRVSAARSLPKNRWVHLAGVYDHSRNALSLYIDGLLEQSLQVLEESSCKEGITYGGKLYLALNKSGGQNLASNLWMDETRVWGVPRNADEISDNRAHLIDPVQETSLLIYSNKEPNALFAYYTFDDGGNTAEDLCHRAKCGLDGYSYPHDSNVITYLNQEYFYGDQAFALDSDALKGPGTAFIFDANRVSPVIGFVDAERGEFDSDRDGLPDAWEIIHELNPFKTNTPDHDQIRPLDPAWALTEGPAKDSLRDMEIPTPDGLNNINEYWAHTNPRKVDTDEDGRLDGDEDFDEDGLPNRVEIAIQSRPDLGDTDDDEYSDPREQANKTSPILSLSPLKNQMAVFNGYPGSFFDVADRFSFRLDSWSLEARVLPLSITNFANGQGASVVRRVIQETTNGLLAANFDLRIIRVGTNLTGQARYTYVDNNGNGRIVSATGNPASKLSDRIGWQQNPADPYPNPGLTHLAATYNHVSGELDLYINGALAARTTEALSRPPVSGRGPYSFVRIGEGFQGMLDEVRFWSQVRSSSDIINNMDAPLTGVSSNLVSYFRMDDGGWLANPVLAPVKALATDPSLVATNVGDRYIIGLGPVGVWANHQGDIAEVSESGLWTYLSPQDRTRVWVTNVVIGYQYATNTDTWATYAEPLITRSVRYLAAPAKPKEGDTWLAGGGVHYYDSGVDRVITAPVRVFVEGQMYNAGGGAIAGINDEFAWWVSRNEFYRFDTGLGGWKRWGQAVSWLGDARLAVEGFAANPGALPSSARVGDVYYVTAPAGFYINNGATWTYSPINAQDRFVSKASGNVYDYDWPNTGLNIIANPSTDGGGLFIFIRGEGTAWRSDGALWQRWGYVPTTEDFTTTHDWMNQWSHAAKLSGGGSFINLTVQTQTVDSDGDGLPDDWEILYGLDPNDPTGDNGPLGDPDGDGLNNLNEYRTGNNPMNSDTNGDGKWDGEEDYDHDGLSNIFEQDNSQTRLDQIDTDDHYLTDWEEVTGYDFTNTAVFAKAGLLRPEGVSNPLRSLDPPKRMSAQFDGNGRLLVPDQTRHALSSWTLEAWVWPSNMADGIVIRRAVTNTFMHMRTVNYELGVRYDAVSNAIIPYTRYIGLETNATHVEVRVDGNGTNETHGGSLATEQIPAEEWSHLAATYDPDAHTLSLYINGDLASYRTDAFPPWGLGMAEGYNYPSEVTVGGGEKTGPAMVAGGFEGFIDEAVILGGASSADNIRKDSASGTALWAGMHTASQPSSPEVVQLPVPEALAYEHRANQLMVRFKPEVTPSQATNLLSEWGTMAIHSYKIAPMHCVAITDGSTMSQKLLQVRSNPQVLFAEPNYRITAEKLPNDPSFDQQWGMHNTGQSGGIIDADIDAPDAWTRATGSRDITVAVID